MRGLGAGLNELNELQQRVLHHASRITHHAPRTTHHAPRTTHHASLLLVTVYKPITIVGGGLAGLTLGIGLRRQDVPVTVLEAGHYPRHRVCGEFISGRGQRALERLGLHDVLIKAGATWIGTASFFLGPSSSPVRRLPQPALSVSRFVLDALLADRFRELGGALREGERCRQSEFGEGIVRASGRRLQVSEGGWRWLGLKAHARRVALGADLEMHGSCNGYVGISRLNADEFNVCAQRHPPRM